MTEPLAVETVPIDDLFCSPSNPRKNDDAVEHVAASLRRFGWRQPVVAKASGEVIAGNTRLKAAKSLGMTEVPVVRFEGTDLDATAYAIADNRTGEFAEWDTPELVALLQDLDKEDSLDGVGFGEDDIQGFLDEMERESRGDVEEDDVPDVPEEATAKVGQLWGLGRHRLVCGDATEASIWKTLKPRDAVVFTSPPYADHRTYGGGKDLEPAHLARFLEHAAQHCSNAVVNLGLQTRDHAIVPYWDVYTAAAAAAGWKLLAWNVWHKEGGLSVGSNTRMFPTIHEWLFVYGEPRELERTHENAIQSGKVRSTERNADGVIDQSSTRERRRWGKLRSLVSVPAVGENSEHPATFPVKLAAEYVKAFGCDVVDPFCGSGTTLIAAEQLGRTCYGLEIEPKYVDVVIARWEKLTGEKAELLDG